MEYSTCIKRIFNHFVWVMLALVLTNNMQAQEIRAEVTVLSPNIQMTNKQVFTTLQTAISNFVNSYKWTELQYEDDERIVCSFVFTITGYQQPSSFSGNLQVQYSRPVFNADYKSPMLNYIDNDISFTYLENEQLDFQPNNHLSNLTSILAFYCNLVIGLDKASMQRGGGQPYFAKLQNIVSNAQTDGAAAGWRSFDGNKSRYWLSDNLNSPAFDAITDAYYSYHRLGMDLMYDPAQQLQAKTNIRDALMSLQDVFQKRPNALLINTFFDAKSDEIVSIFNDGPQLDIRQMVNTLKQIDTGRSSKYQSLEK